jgi:hypothetical protein
MASNRTFTGFRRALQSDIPGPAHAAAHIFDQEKDGCELLC